MAKSFCARPGCNQYTYGSSYCDQHKYTPITNDDKRPTSYQRGYNNAWFRFAAKFRKEHPICEVCKSNLTTVCGHWEMSGSEMLKINNGEFILNTKLYKGLCKSCNAKSKFYRGI